ncbi:hypothetical protein FF80_01866 [Devosia sp. LC5]|uniref:hypothetical protein n=1 Tax=Devosia sp. LC5 TaxID=1502724 RepID=UPI0004E2FF54|nr:hypothetical protein [Devosia sp. LC5]KFC68426.1 hypothetical protein FF80_01866 [Devosia sp. LC5]
MRILNWRPRDAGQIPVMFDIEISPDVRLMDWQLRRTLTGELRVYATRGRHGRPGAVLSDPAFAEIPRLAIQTYKEGNAHDDIRSEAA